MLTNLLTLLVLRANAEPTQRAKSMGVKVHCKLSTPFISF